MRIESFWTRKSKKKFRNIFLPSDLKHSWHLEKKSKFSNFFFDFNFDDFDFDKSQCSLYTCVPYGYGLRKLFFIFLFFFDFNFEYFDFHFDKFQFSCQCGGPLMCACYCSSHLQSLLLFTPRYILLQVFSFSVSSLVS